VAVVWAWARLREVVVAMVETESRDQFSWRYRVLARIGCNWVEWHVLCYPRAALTALSDVCFLAHDDPICKGKRCGGLDGGIQGFNCGPVLGER
jgi:hypothetical protein